jgi:hypothetical protein
MVVRRRVSRAPAGEHEQGEITIHENDTITFASSSNGHAWMTCENPAENVR